ncbi:MAG: hypothetical protein KAR33_04710 [Candidatus Thorarchaeota archaeon]|nr:hypothetical protein [Candidatus Thorarchaeota archaeon]
MTSVIDHSRMSQIRNKIIKWYKSDGRRFPWRETSNPYEIVIAEMMLRRTTAAAVTRVYPKFIKKYPDIESLSFADEHEIKQTVQSLGLQNQRSKHLQRMSRYLLKEFNGDIAAAKSNLRSLPGVGRYVASAIRNFALGESTHMVDGNIVHLLQRILGLSFSGPNDELVWSIMKDIGGIKQDKHLYWGIIDIVAQLCLRKNPRCSMCPLEEECTFNQSKK